MLATLILSAHGLDVALSGEVLDELFEGVSAADRARITRGNVKALYGV